MNTKWPTYFQNLPDAGTVEPSRVDIHVVLCVFYVGIIIGAKCVIVRQVFNGVSDEIQRTFTYFCFCVDVHVFMTGSLYWCAHCTPWPW